MSSFLPVTIPIPVNDPIATPRNRVKYKGSEKDPNEGLVAPLWNGFFSQQNSAISAAPARVSVVSLEAQAASIPATDLTGGNLTGGLYQVWVYARITQAAGGSSSLVVTLDWQDGGVTCTSSATDWPTMNGNTTATTQTMVKMVQVDGLTPVRYATTRTSGGAPSMQYALTIVLLRVNLG